MLTLPLLPVKADWRAEPRGREQEQGRAGKEKFITCYKYDNYFVSGLSWDRDFGGRMRGMDSISSSMALMNGPKRS